MKKLPQLAVKGAGLFLLGLVTAANAAPVVLDHFDDANLDPAWQVSFTNADGWSSTETGTNLTATEVDALANNLWASVHLTRSFAALLDFQADFDLSWDSEGSINAMQGLHFHLLDSTGGRIVTAGYDDAWVGNSGGRFGTIANSNTLTTAVDTLPLSGSASIAINRIGADVDIFWDGVNILSGVNATSVAGVELEFRYFPFSGGNGTSFFGNESLDLVSVGDTSVVPLPAPFLLLGAALTSLGWFKRKRSY